MAIDLLEYLKHIDPVSCNYEEWVEVGMALKAEGYDCSVWDEWSRQDPRYKEGECYWKWNTFGADGVKGGTIVHMAAERGFSPSKDKDWEPKFYGFQDTINIHDFDWMLNRPDSPRENLLKPMYQEGYRQLTEYLLALFEPDDIVSYVLTTRENNDGERRPDHGVFCFTAGQLIQKLDEKKDIENALGTIDQNTGGWIRFNPVDGIVKGNKKGMSDVNVTAFRYALVESDHVPLDRQIEIYKELRLPIAAMVYSGGKSVHAIVRVDAQSKSEYKKKVDYLYAACSDHGLIVDTQNKNASRLSRLPGIVRGDEKQTLLSLNSGFEDYAQWKKWHKVQKQQEEFPKEVALHEISDNFPELADMSIDRLLRKAHKLILTGPSKAGKSYALISLAICYAEGLKWFDEFQVSQGKVFYINLEIDEPSFYKRIRDVYDAMGIPEDQRRYDNLVIWNLRGYAKPLDELLPIIIEKVKDKGYSAVIIDPAYKVITGDENSSRDMTYFNNLFDELRRSTNCSVIYCHHHSKSAANYRDSMNRGSGSTVFSRDPDCILDLTKFEQSKEYVSDMVVHLEKVQLPQNLKAIAQAKMIDTNADDWMEVFKEHFPDDFRKIHEDIESRLKIWKKRQEMGSECWQLDGTIREFRWDKPVKVWFDFPLHHVDHTTITVPELPKLATATDDPMIRAHEARKKQSKERGDDIASVIKDLNREGVKPTVPAILERLQNEKGQKDLKAHALRGRITRNDKRFKIVDAVVYDLTDEEYLPPKND